MERSQGSIYSQKSEYKIKDSLLTDELTAPLLTSGRILQQSKRSTGSQSEAATLAIKALQSKVRQLEDENEFLKEKIKSGIEDMSKFEIRFRVEKDKWQIQTSEELKMYSEREAKMKYQFDKLEADNNQLQAINSKLTKKFEALEKEQAIQNERSIKESSLLNDLHKCIDSLNQEKAMLETSYNECKYNLEETNRKYEEDMKMHTTVIEQLRDEKIMYLKEMERISQECDEKEKENNVMKSEKELLMESTLAKQQTYENRIKESEITISTLDKELQALRNENVNLKYKASEAISDLEHCQSIHKEMLDKKNEIIKGVTDVNKKLVVNIMEAKSADEKAKTDRNLLVDARSTLKSIERDPSVVTSPCYSNSVVGPTERPTYQFPQKQVETQVRSLERDIDDLYSRFTNLIAQNVNVYSE